MFLLPNQCLETLENLLSSSQTSSVVRECLLEAVAAAAYASGTSVKPYHKPDQVFWTFLAFNHY